MSKRILVVDDAIFMRMMLKDILVSSGYQVAGEAASAEEAIAKYEELSPDLVTLDVIMPGKNGIDAMKEILARHPDARIVIVSAMGQEALINEAIQAGAKSFVVKPFRPPAVAATLREVLGE